MVTEIEAASLLTQKASEMKNQNLSVTQSGAMAKLFASETCVKLLMRLYKSMVVMDLQRIIQLRNF